MVNHLIAISKLKQIPYQPVFILPMLVTATMSIGCTPDTPQQSDEWQDISDAGLIIYNADGLNRQLVTQLDVVPAPQLIQANQMEKQKTEKEVKKLEEGLKNSYARLAARRADTCPKLLQQDVDTNVIQRSNDILVGDYCDYFIYPLKGRRIEVISSNDQIKPSLIAPVPYDFTNGAYMVQTSQKHVIRLSYNGTRYKPESLRYDVSVTVK